MGSKWDMRECVWWHLRGPSVQQNCGAGWITLNGQRGDFSGSVETNKRGKRRFPAIAMKPSARIKRRHALTVGLRLIGTSGGAFGGGVRGSGSGVKGVRTRRDGCGRSLDADRRRQLPSQLACRRAFIDQSTPQCGVSFLRQRSDRRVLTRRLHSGSRPSKQLVGEQAQRAHATAARTAVQRRPVSGSPNPPR